MGKRPARDHRLNTLGEAAMRALGAGNFERAETLASEALAVSPGLAPALAVRASASVRLRKYDQAERDILAAIRTQPSPPPQWTATLATVYRGRGELDRAIELLISAHADFPAAQIITSSLGELLATTRRHDEAFALLADAVSRGADRPGLVAQYGRVCRILGRTADAIGPLTKAAARLDQPATGRQQVLFELGMAFDALGQPDEAFDAFRRANALEARVFDIESQGLAIDTTINAWTREALSEIPRTPGVGEEVVFIVGMRRSGTTLVEQILAAHPLVSAQGERRWLRAASKPFATDAEHRLGVVTDLSRCTQQLVADASRCYLQQVASVRGDAGIVTDKMPANFKLLGLVELALPAARVVWCRRDPINTCLSCYMQPFNDNSYCADLRTLARYNHDCERLMAHWREQLDLPIFELAYETLVANPERTVGELLEFLGLPYREECLRFETAAPVARTASTDQVARGLYRSSIDRAEQYRAHLAPLKDELERLGQHHRNG